jgi:hypothetical protein
MEDEGKAPEITVDGMQRAPEYIMARWKRAKEDCQPWHNKIAMYRKLYDNKHYSSEPKAGERRINLPEYQNVVDLAVGILGSKPVEFRAYGFTPGEAEQNQGSRVEKLLQACMYVNGVRQEIDIQKTLLKMFVRDTVGCLRTVWDNEYADEYMEEQGYSDVPIRWQVVDAMNVYPVPGGKNRWLCIFHAVERSIADVEAAENISIPAFNKMSKEEKERTKHQWLDYWEFAKAKVEELDDDDNVLSEHDSVVVRNATIYADYLIDPLEVKEGYHDLTYTIFFYDPTPENDPKLWGKGILTALMELVPHLETRFNRQTRLVDLYASQNMVSKTADARKIRTDPALGKIVPLGLNEDLGWPQWPGTPPDVTQQIAFLQGAIQQSSFPQALYGQGVSTMAGYAISQLVSTGQIRLVTPGAQLGLAWTIVANKTMALLREFAEAPIICYGVHEGNRFQETVSVEDAVGLRVDADVMSTFPGEDVQSVAMATQATPHLSHSTILERYYHIQQPNDEIRRMEIEQVRKNPAMLEIVMMEYLKELAAEEAENKDSSPKIYGALLQRYMSQGMPGKPGRPGEPPNPMQPMGLQSPTGQPVPGATGEEPYGQEQTQGLEDLVTYTPSLTGGFGG